MLNDTFIGFSKSTKGFPILGRAIEALQGGRYSHCFIAVHIKGHGHFVIDATGSGVRVRSMEMFLKENRIVKKYKLPNCSQENNMNLFFWGLNKSGQKYPMIEVVGNLYQLIVWNLFKKVVKNPFGKGDNFPRCNELVAQGLKEVFDHDIKEDLDSIDLIWLDDYLRDMGLVRY